MSDRKLILFIAASLDGYIATETDDLSFLSLVEHNGEDYGYTKFISTVDTVIMGRKTFDWVKNHTTEFPHSGKETYIITHQKRPDIGKTVFYGGNIKDLVLGLKSRKGKNIFCDGGAELVDLLLKENLIDEIVLSLIPVLLGTGKRLFRDGRTMQNIHLAESRSYPSGLVQLHYLFTDDKSNHNRKNKLNVISH